MIKKRALLFIIFINIFIFSQKKGGEIIYKIEPIKNNKRLFKL